METTEPGRRIDRESARRGILLLLVALAVGLAYSLVHAGLIEWLFREIEAGRPTGDAMELIQTVSRVGTALSILVALAVAFGCGLLGRGARTRAWSYVAIAAALAGGCVVLVQVALHRDGAVELGTLRLGFALGAAASLVEWVAIGLAARAAMRAAGLGVSRGAAATWLAAIGLELLFGLARTGVLSSLFAWDQARLVAYGLSSAAVVARLILLAAARRALVDSDAGAGAADEGADPLTADDPSSPAAAGALGLYRAGLLLHVATTVLAAIVGVAAGLAGSAPGAVLGVVAVPELIAAGLIVVGLVRLGALPSASVARLASVCVVAAVAIQAYAASIVWRLTAYTDRAASGSWGGMSLSDVLDLSRRLPALELGATIASLIGFLSVAAALHATSEWLGRPALGARAVALSVGLSFVALVAGCLRLYLATAGRPAVELVMVVGIAAIAIGLALFVSYLGVLGKIIERLRGAAAALPAARVVADGRAPDPPAA